MKINIFLSAVAFCLFLVASELVRGRTSNKLITKLSPKSLLGEYGRKGKAKSVNDVFPYKYEPVESSNTGYILNDRAKGTIQGFLDNTNEDTVGALFLVLDEKERETIQGLLRNIEGDKDMKAVWIFKFHKTKEMIQLLLKQGEDVNEIKAVLIVRDNKAKEIIEDLLKQDQTKKEVKVVLIGRDEKAKTIIESFIAKEKHHSPSVPEKTLEWENLEKEKYDREKDEQAKELIKTMFNKQENKAKDMFETLLGHDAKINEIISTLPEGNSKAKTMMKDMLGQDEKVKNFIKALLGGWVNTGFVIKGDKSKDIKPFLGKNDLSKTVNDGLLDKDGQGFRCGLPSYEEETDKTHLIMEGLFAQLRSYIMGSRFDHQNFEKMGRHIEELILTIEARVNKVLACSPVLAEELAFAKVMFHTMVESIEILMYYENTDFPGHMFVYYMIDLNVRLLGLRNRRGIPDPRIDGYVAKVKTFIQYMNFWNGEFRVYEHILFGRLMFFRKQFEMAQATLIMLARTALNSEE